MPLKPSKKKCRLGSENILLIATVSAVLLGILIGIAIKFSHTKLDPRQISYLNFPGEVFMRALKMLILPLIVSSLINSIVNLETKTAGRLGLVTMVFYFSTTILAVITGIILVVSIKPGTYARDQTSSKKTEVCPGGTPLDTIFDLMRNMFPMNLVQMGYMSERTCFKFKRQTNANESAKDISYELFANLSHDNPSEVFSVPYLLKEESGMNVLGIVFFALVLGVVMSINRRDTKGLVVLFQALEFASMKLIMLVIWYSPVGIMFLIIASILKMNDLMGELHRLGMYILTVLLGLFIHGCISLMVLLFLLGRHNPLAFVFNMAQAYLTALGTSSSSATMPLTMQCLEENVGIDKRVSRFMIPLGATINMDGTALYEAVAAIYIAQSIDKWLSFGEVIIVSLTATLASIGAAGIPQAGLVTMVMVLVAVGLPADNVALILPIDWFLDRIRTTVNVHGDSVGAAVVARICRRQLEEPIEHDPRSRASVSSCRLSLAPKISISRREVVARQNSMLGMGSSMNRLIAAENGLIAPFSDGSSCAMSLESTPATQRSTVAATNLGFVSPPPSNATSQLSVMVDVDETGKVGQVQPKITRGASLK